MHLSVVRAGAAALIGALTIATAAAQNYPQRPVRMIIANGPGTAPDVIGRLVANKLAESWGQPVIVDNRPGATGLIAAELTARAAPDGYTLFLSTMTQLISTLMSQKHMLATELGAVTLVGTTPFAIVVGPNVPAKNIGEWVAHAKARQGQLRYGSAGNWGSGHLCMERFNAMNGLKLTHVPYANTVHAMTDIAAGSIHVYCTAVPSLPSFTAVGKVRVLGVTYREPTRLLPDVPPVGDTVPGFELYGWYGMNVPLRTPPDLVKRINAELVRTLKDPQLRDRMLAAGAEAVGSTPAEFAAFLGKQTEQWTKVLKDSGAKLGQSVQ